jgi:hypothetical protein
LLVCKLQIHVLVFPLFPVLYVIIAIQLDHFFHSDGNTTSVLKICRRFVYIRMYLFTKTRLDAYVSRQICDILLGTEEYLIPILLDNKHRTCKCICKYPFRSLTFWFFTI